MSDTIPNDWLVAVARRAQLLIRTQYALPVNAMPFVQTVPPEQLPAMLAAIRITEGEGAKQRTYKIDVRRPEESARDIEVEAARVVALFIAQRGLAS